MRAFLKIMKALSDANRVKMVKMLQRRVMCVCEIQSALRLSQSTASKHLKILEEAGLISFTKEGLWVNYRLADATASPLAREILMHLRQWLEDDADIQALMAKLPQIQREIICRR
jgi:ArsR family transcriptional regulator